MDTIGIKPGMTIAEVGAGTGRITMWIAERVGNSGKVYATDINKSALEHMRERCQLEFRFCACGKCNDKVKTQKAAQFTQSLQIKRFQINSVLE